MKKTLVKWSCLAIGVLASCQQRDLSEGISSDSLALNLQASVAGELYQERLLNKTDIQRSCKVIR